MGSAATTHRRMRADGRSGIDASTKVISIDWAILLGFGEAPAITNSPSQMRLGKIASAIRTWAPIVNFLVFSSHLSTHFDRGRQGA
jgi:hypothetical protein